MKQKNIWIVILASCVILSSCKEEFDDIQPLSLTAEDQIESMDVVFANNSGVAACNFDPAKIEISGKTKSGLLFSTSAARPTGTLKADCSMFNIDFQTRIGNYINDQSEPLSQTIASIENNCTVLFNSKALALTEETRPFYAVLVGHNGFDTKVSTIMDCAKTSRSPTSDTLIRTKKSFLGSYYATVSENIYEAYTLYIDYAGNLHHVFWEIDNNNKTTNRFCQVSEKDGYIKVKDKATNSSVTDSTQDTYVSVNCSTQADQEKKYELNAAGDLVITYGATSKTYKKQTSQQGIVPTIDLPLESEEWRELGYPLETSRPYPQNANENYKVYVSGAREMYLLFDYIFTTSGNDFVYIRDWKMESLQSITGINGNSAATFRTVTVPGDTININLVSDDKTDANELGFRLLKVYYRK